MRQKNHGPHPGEGETHPRKKSPQNQRTRNVQNHADEMIPECIVAPQPPFDPLDQRGQRIIVSSVVSAQRIEIEPRFPIAVGRMDKGIIDNIKVVIPQPSAVHRRQKD